MQKISKLVVTIVTVGVATAVLAGVAGAGSTLSKKDYLKQGNAICKDGNAQLEVVFRQAFEGLGKNDRPSDAQIEQAVGGAVPIFRTVLGEIEALEGPPALDTKVDALVAKYQAKLDEIEADPASAFGDADPFKKLDKQSRKLGLKTCAQS